MRQKPVLMFGHFFFQYAPGVSVIRTSEECKRAIEQILQRKESHSIRDIRLFLKAVDACATPYPGLVRSPVEEPPREQKTENVGAMLERKIRSVLARHGTAV
ncbi:MAG: hypothetical protein PHX87_00570 [Candidatus Peribacteraceae bacterium]|nr:hypothetical protein [Candidatus Peribacteraceae bacterium]MDD5741901.1 hypothetical protein [Candidatus Peribacteraceae bacterium]